MRQCRLSEKESCVQHLRDRSCVVTANAITTSAPSGILRTYVLRVPRIAHAGRSLEEPQVRWRLVDVRVNPYDDERLARLLRLFRPAPRDWITKAQRIFFDLSIPGQARAAETRLTDGDLVVLRHALDDSLFRQRFDTDPIAAAQAAELHELALRLASEMRELVALAERIAVDDVYRAELDADPEAALVAAGMPATIAEPLLQALAVSDDVLAKLPEVVAHQHEPPTLKARLIITLLGSAAVVGAIRSRARRA